MKLTGSCHCGATKFEVASVPQSVLQCTCSICSKLGGLWAYYRPEDFRLLERPSSETTYRWSSKTIAFKFCPSCGCSTYNETLDWSTGEAGAPMIAINARLLDDLDIDTIPVERIDGKNLW
ncbi:MAG: GFA family protein [Rhizobiaceae bacterium]|nr:MAG: GFA family protein [Rhizobiaceae bacterium]